IRLREEMEGRQPDPGKISSKARAAAHALRSTIPELAAGRYESWDFLSGRFAAMARDDRDLVGSGWDGGAQLYLALAAIYHAQGDLYPEKRDPRFQGSIKSMGGALSFARRPSGGSNRPLQKTYADDVKGFREAL